MQTVNEYAHIDITNHDLAECVLSYLRDLEQRLTFTLSLTDRIDLGDTLSHAEELVRRTRKEVKI